MAHAARIPAPRAVAEPILAMLLLLLHLATGIAQQVSVTLLQAGKRCNAQQRVRLGDAIATPLACAALAVTTTNAARCGLTPPIIAFEAEGGGIFSVGVGACGSLGGETAALLASDRAPHTARCDIEAVPYVCA